MSSTRVTGMPHAWVSQEGDEVELEFTGDDGQKFKLHYSSDDFERFVTRAIQLFGHARSQKHAIGDHVAIHPVAAAAATALAPEGGGKVILLIRDHNGIPYPFALDPDDAEELRPELYRAAKIAKKHASQSRH